MSAENQSRLKSVGVQGPGGVRTVMERDFDAMTVSARLEIVREWNRAYIPPYEADLTAKFLTQIEALIFTHAQLEYGMKTLAAIENLVCAASGRKPT